MNLAQFLSLARKALTLGGAYLIQNGHATAGNFINGEDFIGLVLFLIGLAWSHVVHKSDDDSQPGQSRLPMLPFLVTASVCIVSITGCHTTKLASGGAYAPTIAGTTNAASNPDLGLYFADAAYKLAFDAVDGVFKFELANRAQLQKVSPAIKTNLDKIRPTAWQIERRWALARAAYRANPTPAGLSQLQTILSEISRLVPVAQSQLSLATTNNN